MLNDKYIDLFFRVKINFIDRTGTKISVMAEVGDNLLDVAKDADIDGVEGGFILFTYFCFTDFLIFWALIFFCISTNVDQ